MAIVKKRVSLKAKCTECRADFEVNKNDVTLDGDSVSIVCPDCKTEYVLEHLGGPPKGSS